TGPSEGNRPVDCRAPHPRRGYPYPLWVGRLALRQGGRDMVSMVGSVTILIAMSSTNGIFFHRDPNNLVFPPQPGFGAGDQNGNPDGYGYYDHGVSLPLTVDRTAEYYFPRYLAVPASQSFFPTYYNPYVSRGQRFIPYAGCGGPHPMSGPPRASAM